MKKTLISLGVVIAMLSSLICPAVMASDVFEFGNPIGSEIYDTQRKYGKNIVETDKYVFLVAGNSSSSVVAKSTVHIYEKPTAEHRGYKYLTSISQRSSDSDATLTLPVRDLWIKDDTLYINWNNAKTVKSDKFAFPSRLGHTSPLYRYNIADISEGATLTPTLVGQVSYREPEMHPYNRGGASFLDEENELLYMAKHTGRDLAGIGLTYVLYDLSNAAHPVSKSIKGGSVDTTQFIVKDGYLFEVLQNNGGISTTTERVSQAFNNVRIYDISELATGSDIQTKFLGSYTTAISGDWVINDIEINGDTAYLATTSGLEVVDISDAKEASPGSPVELTLSERLYNGKTTNAVVLKDDILYVGLNNAMVIYDTSTGTPVEIGTYEVTGGFKDFSVNTEENLIYALSAAQNGGLTILNLDLLLNKLEVSDVTYTENNGELSAQMTITNPGVSPIEFTSHYMLYEGNRLAQISTQDWSLDPDESVDFSDAVEIDDTDNIHAKIILTTIGASPRTIPMVNETSIVFEQNYGTNPSVSASSDDVMNVADMDSYGNIVVSGKVEEFKGTSMLVMVENTTAGDSDRLEKVRYMDVVTVGEDGSYAFAFMPSDSGTYSIDMKNILGVGNISDDVVVDEVEISVLSGEELPGIESLLFINLINGQNTHEIDFEMTFDSSVVEVSEEIIVCDEFEASNVAVENGTLSITFTKQSDVTIDERDLCTVPFTVKSDAVLGDYALGVTVTVTDKYDTVLDTVTNDGVLSIMETTQKYIARDAAIAAMTALKDADELTVEDYLVELAKLTDAKAKVEVAYSYLLRDSQLGTALIEKLGAVEEKLTEFIPYYEAVDVVEAAEAADMQTTLNTNKAFFNITDEALALYAGATNKALIDTELAAEDFDTPGDVYNAFHKSLVFNSFFETRWQNVDRLLGYAEKGTELDTSAYNDLETAERKAYVQQELQLRTYADVATLQSALNTAVEGAIINVPLPDPDGDGPSGDTDGYSPGNTRVPGSSVFDQDTGVEVKPPAPVAKSDVFSDIAQSAWAKEAIEYLNGKGIINGIGGGKFAPMENVTREAFFKMIALGFGISGAESDITFTDVEDGTWYSEYAYALAGAGIINGRGDGRLGVGEYITREEIAVILDRVSQLKAIDIKPNKEVSIPDAENIGEYAVSAVNKMWASGIINGFEDGTVRPKETASRAQVAQLIYKVMLMQSNI